MITEVFFCLLLLLRNMLGYSGHSISVADSLMPHETDCSVRSSENAAQFSVSSLLQIGHKKRHSIESSEGKRFKFLGILQFPVDRQPQNC